MKKVREMNSKLIQITEPNFRLANVKMVESILECLGIDIPEEAKIRGLQ
jgi:hypothetical protein